MRALLYGIQPPRVPQPDTDNPLVAALARTPMRPRRDATTRGSCCPDWVSPGRASPASAARTPSRCSSTSARCSIADNPMSDFFSFPQVMGHEVVADVVELGPEAEGLEVGERVVLNPWLSCGPRGMSPLCPACEAGDLSLCWSFTAGPIAPGHPHRHVEGRDRRLRELMPAHDTHAVPGARLRSPTSTRCSPTRSRCRCTPITRHPPPPGGKVLVYGAGALGSCAVAILRALYPDVEVLRRRALRRAGRAGAQARRDAVSARAARAS